MPRNPPKQLKHRRRNNNAYRKKGNKNHPKGIVALTQKGGQSILADRLFSKLIYNETLTTSPTTTMYVYQYRCNSLFDPNYTGVGHQPRGFDQMAAIYNDYRVRGVHVDLLVSTNSATERFFAGIHYHGGLTANVTNKNDAQEDRQAILGHGCRERPVRIRKYLSMERIFGKSTATLRGEKEYAAGAGANPVIPGAINIFAQNENESTSVYLMLNVTLTYYAEFTNPLTIAQS